MDIPPEVRREPLHRLVGATQVSDDEMRQLLKDASREAEQIVKMHGKGAGIGARVRQAQLDLARQQRQMWASVGHQARVAIGDGVDAAADSISFMNEVMLNAVGGASEFWRGALLAQARSGIPTLLARRENGITLSDRVYRNAALSSGKIDSMINGMIVNGASAREIATRVRGFIDPATPGGASYAAMRLGRSELNNAFHTTSINVGKSQPWVKGQKWNLSGSHPKPDLCDEYASQRNGMGPGVFAPGDVPAKPHPQCLCYITAVTPSREEFIKNFTAGKYDHYIDRQMGCSSVA